MVNDDEYLISIIKGSSALKNATKQFQNLIEDNLLKFGHLDNMPSEEEINQNGLLGKPNLYGTSLYTATIFGGIQKVTATITDIERAEVIDHGHKGKYFYFKYSVNYKLSDTFGASPTDANRSIPGLKEQFILQKYYGEGGKYQSFIHHINIKVNVEGRSSVPKD